MFWLSNKTSTQLFASAGNHFGKAAVAVAKTPFYAGKTATYGANTAIKAVFGIGAAETISGKIVTGYASSFFLPAGLLKTGLTIGFNLVSKFAPALYLGAVAVSLATDSKNIIETGKNAYKTIASAGDAAKEVALGVKDVLLAGASPVADKIEGFINPQDGFGTRDHSLDFNEFNESVKLGTDSGWFNMGDDTPMVGDIELVMGDIA